MTKSDSRISQDAMNELRSDRTVNPASVIVSCVDGVASLNGWVETPAEKWLVERAVRRIAGVKSIKCQLDVRPPQRETSTDDEIGRECEKALDVSMPGPNHDIRVMVSNGWVTLSGKVAWGYERWAAEAVVSSLRGVTGVNSQVTVRPIVAQREVENNLNSILSELFGKGGGIPSSLYAEVLRGKVTLSGTVQSHSDRRAARNAVLSTPGVNKLIDHTVLPEGAQ
ncbi:BON domain-containing protein [Herbaspirillum sp. GCM10030257]|uniref:BON domain-containing protein n=1 Tax=Herbaspirillum sp. GCM10030257 TaxID=3273393 RepID=UPI0036162F4B